MDNSKTFIALKDAELQDDKCYKVRLKDIPFQLTLLKKVFINEDGHKGILYLVSNDLSSNDVAIYKIYQKRWKIEEFHKSIKQNASLEKSPTKRKRSQSNHIFASIISVCKLECIKLKTCLNHFAIKYKLIIRSNQIAFQELQSMRV